MAWWGCCIAPNGAHFGHFFIFISGDGEGFTKKLKKVLLMGKFRLEHYVFWYTFTKLNYPVLGAMYFSTSSKLT